MEIVIAIVGFGVLYYVINLNQRKKQSREMMELMIGAVDAKRDREPEFLEGVLQTRNIDLNDTGATGNDAVCIAVSQFIAKDIASRTGINLLDTTDDSVYVSMIFCLIATDYLSRHLDSNFEFVSSAACLTLAGTDDLEKSTELFKDAIDEYNSMASGNENSEILQAIGNRISEFCNSNSNEHLEKLAGIYKILLKAVSNNGTT